MISQIRKAIFETNSSSTHVLSITSCAMDKMKIPKKLHINTDAGFGWEHSTHYYPNAKISYIYAVICNCNNYEELYIRLEALLSVVDCKLIKTGENDGYVDHGYDAIEFVKMLLDNPDKLYAFLFNDESFIETGNDNCDILTDKYPYDPDDDGWGINKNKVPGDYVYIKGN